MILQFVRLFGESFSEELYNFLFFEKIVMWVLDGEIMSKRVRMFIIDNCLGWVEEMVKLRGELIMAMLKVVG